MTSGEQMAMLRELISYAANEMKPDDKEDLSWPRDFEDMLERMEGARLTRLTSKQESYMKDVYERMIGAPQYENLISSGKAPRGREEGTAGEDAAMSAWEGSAQQEAQERTKAAERAKAVVCDHGTAGCPGRGEKHMCPEMVRSVQGAEDLINHPLHYTSHPANIECIDVTEHMNFNLGNAVKYLWRQGQKAGASSIVDLRKSIWYIEREIARLEKAGK